MHGVVVTVARVFFTLQNLLLSQVCAFLLTVNLVLLFFDYQLSCFFCFFSGCLQCRMRGMSRRWSQSFASKWPTATTTATVTRRCSVKRKASTMTTSCISWQRVRWSGMGMCHWLGKCAATSIEYCNILIALPGRLG